MELSFDDVSTALILIVGAPTFESLVVVMW